MGTLLVHNQELRLQYKLICKGNTEQICKTVIRKNLWAIGVKTLLTNPLVAVFIRFNLLACSFLAKFALQLWIFNANANAIILILITILIPGYQILMPILKPLITLIQGSAIYNNKGILGTVHN